MLSIEPTERDALVKKHSVLVQQIARRYSRMAQSHYEDLVQVGYIGLLNAIERFDPNQGSSFKTYASHLITSEIRHYLRDQTAVVKPPRELQELLPRLRSEEQRQAQEGEALSPQECAERLGISLKKLQELRRYEKNLHTLSLDQTVGSAGNKDNKTTALDLLPNTELKSFQLTQDDKIFLQDGLSKIKGQSREVIEFAFYHDLTQTEIAKQLGISQMQVSRRLKKAMGELWDTLNTRVTPW